MDRRSNYVTLFFWLGILGSLLMIMMMQFWAKYARGRESPQPPPTSQAESAESSDQSSAHDGRPASPRRVEISRMENTFFVQDKLFSGGQPESEADFLALKKIGIKTILSVDGTPPNVVLAKKHGLRYVHLPISYDEVPNEKALLMLKAVKESPGGVYIHCHHGKHRGPAAAAVVCRGLYGWKGEEAVQWLKQAQTSPDYAGLYRSVQAFLPPQPEEIEKLPGDLPESTPPEALVDAMVKLDRHWERLTKLDKLAYQPGDKRLDFSPAEEARLLAEFFRELSRRENSRDKRKDFIAFLKAGEMESLRLKEALKALDKESHKVRREAAAAAFKQIGTSCKECHKQYRD